MFQSKQGLLDFAEIGMGILKDAKSLKHIKTVKKFVQEHADEWTEAQVVRPRLADFSVKAELDKGHFGKVCLVKNKADGAIFAMKTMCKDVNLKDKARFREERELMATTTSPWLTQLHYAFHDDTNLYLVMDYHPGGNLWTLLGRPEIFGLGEEDCRFPERAAMFYATEIALAIQAVHDMGFVHRDIKTDNIVINAAGHVRLVDFGSSAKMDPAGKVYGRAVGTPQYIAPELLEGLSVHGKEVDWWSFGVVVYEMLTGRVPFDGDSEIEIYGAISQFEELVPSLEYPACVSKPARALVAGLLRKCSSRLDARAILSHEAMRVWTEAKDKDGCPANMEGQEPPYVPVLAHAEDTSHFPQDDGDKTPFAERQRISLATNTMAAIEHGFDVSKLDYAGFTFVRESEAEEQDASADDEEREKTASKDTAAATTGSAVAANSKPQLRQQQEQENMSPLGQRNVRASMRARQDHKVTALKRENKCLNDEVQQLKRQASIAQRELRHLKQKVRRSTDSAAVSVNQLEATQEKEQRLQRRVQQLEADLERARAVSKQAQADAKRIAALEEAEAMAKKQLARTQADNASLEEQVQALMRETDTLRLELAAASKEKKDMRRAATVTSVSTSAEVDAARSQVRKHKATIDELQQQLLDRTQEVQALGCLLKTTTEERDSLNKEKAEHQSTIADLEERLRKLNVSTCNMMEGFYTDLQEATEMASKYESQWVEAESAAKRAREARAALEEELQMRDQQLHKQTAQLNDAFRQLDKERQHFTEKVRLLEEEVNGMATDNLRLEAVKAQHGKLLDTILTNAASGNHQHAHMRPKLKLRLFRGKQRHKFAARPIPALPKLLQEHLQQQQQQQSPKGDATATVTAATAIDHDDDGDDVPGESCRYCTAMKSELRLAKRRLHDTVLQLQRMQAELDEGHRPAALSAGSFTQSPTSASANASAVSSGIVPLTRMMSRMSALRNKQLYKSQMKPAASAAVVVAPAKEKKECASATTAIPGDDCSKADKGDSAPSTPCLQAMHRAQTPDVDNRSGCEVGVTDLDMTGPLAVTSSQVVTPQMPRSRYERFANVREALEQQEQQPHEDGSQSPEYAMGKRSCDAVCSHNNTGININITSASTGAAPSLRRRRALGALDGNVLASNGGTPLKNKVHTAGFGNASRQQNLDSSLLTSIVGGDDSVGVAGAVTGDENTKPSARPVRVLLLSEGSQQWAHAVLELRESMLSLRAVSDDSQGHEDGEVLTFFDLRRCPSAFVVSTHLSSELSVLEAGGEIAQDSVVYVSHHPPCWVGQEVLIETDSTASAQRLARTLKATVQRYAARVTTDDAKWQPHRVCALNAPPLVLQAARERRGSASSDDDGAQQQQQQLLLCDGVVAGPGLTVLKMVTLLDGSQLLVSEEGLYWTQTSGVGAEEQLQVVFDAPAFVCKDTIHDAECVRELGVLVLVVGEQRRMCVLKLSALHRSSSGIAVADNSESVRSHGVRTQASTTSSATTVSARSGATARAERQRKTSEASQGSQGSSSSSSSSGSGEEDVSLEAARERGQKKLKEIEQSHNTLAFAVGTVVAGRTFLFSAHTDCMALFEWRARERAFVLSKQAHGPRYTDPTTCLKYVASLRRFVWGSSRFSMLEPLELDIEDLLDVDDSNLAMHLSNEERGNVFPIDVFELGHDKLLLCFSRYGLVVNLEGRVVSTEPSLEWHVNVPQAFALVGEQQLCVVGRQSVELQDLGNRRSRVVSLANCGVLGTASAHAYLVQSKETHTYLLKLEKPSATIRASFVSAFSSLINADPREVLSKHVLGQSHLGPATRGVSPAKELTTSAFSERFRNEIAALDDVLGAFDL
ncbi:AGC/DMPK protein kinase [Salpingoeca rosetta]|uniref:non-specific serine/threonine protein kinase n=1 Tax=Salpingoeca rosetta (strain ATCC 50818 / BSB-021) TaxID=946362 RepID=F2US59_SALR5|nr:AGC/DMPK protein kinase [Salpingoeca rosetta]EGD80464.1 AGC/DMPK protein kinase [Salpingoeca rosetta]|eukprot:XP_004988028.1 AGC/DMPK protein kinase [Salpingoeca rosetta]